MHQETVAELLAIGIDDATRRAKYRHEKELKHARELGRLPNFTETLSPWKKSLLTCPYQFRVQGDLRIGPLAKDPNRSYGSSVHKGAELLARGDSYERAVRAFNEDWKKRSAVCSFEGKRYGADEFSAMGPKALAAILGEFDQSEEIVADSVEHWFDQVPVEDPDTGEVIEGFAYAGRCDFVRKKKGDPGFVIEDLKNLARLTKESDAPLASHVDEQLTIYAVLAAKDSLLGEIGIEHTSRIEVNKAKTKITAFRWPVRHVDEAARRALYYSSRDAIMRILTYRDAEEQGAPLHEAWPRNHAACFGKYGLCDLAPICHPQFFPETDIATEFGLQTFD